MNVQVLRQANVITTLRVTTLMDLTRAAVLMDIRVMVKTAQVNNNLSFYAIHVIKYVIFRNHYAFNLPAVGCSPICGPDAACQENGGPPSCECNAGFLGDGYNCTGLSMYTLMFFLL